MVIYLQLFTNGTTGLGSFADPAAMKQIQLLFQKKRTNSRHATKTTQLVAHCYSIELLGVEILKTFHIPELLAKYIVTHNYFSTARLQVQDLTSLHRQAITRLSSKPQGLASHIALLVQLRVQHLLPAHCAHT